MLLSGVIASIQTKTPAKRGISLNFVVITLDYEPTSSQKKYFCLKFFVIKIPSPGYVAVDLTELSSSKIR